MICALAHLGPCNGAMTRHHCVPKQRLRNEFPNGASLNPLTGRKYVPADRREAIAPDVPLRKIVADTRNFLWICFHHHLGWEKRAPGIRIDRELIPQSVEDFARDYGLTWSLERDYGLRREVAA